MTTPHLTVLPLNRPEVVAPAPRERFGVAAWSTDDQVRRASRGLLEAFLTWSRRLTRP